VRTERLFGDLLRSMNDGLEVPLAHLSVLDRGTHGWVEFATHESTWRRTEAARYFHRAGALMCLTSVLGARDLHRDNLVATAGGPVLVDLELLLQPDRFQLTENDDGPAGSDATGDAGTRSGRSDVACLSTGMLSLIDLTPDGEPHDAGGLRGERTGALPFPTRVWHGRGTDTLHFVDELTFAAAGTHQVTVDGVVCDPGDFANELVTGFSQAYRLLMARRDDLLSPRGPLAALATCVVRILPRPTNQYAMLAWLLATPKYQHDGVMASCAIDVLHRGFTRSARRPALWPVAVEERRAMLALDVPYFSTRGDGTDAYADGHLVAPGYFTRSGLDLARDRIGALTLDDLAAQTALLRRALSESVASTYGRARDDGRPKTEGLRGAEVDAALIDAAEWLAEALLARAERTADGLVWRYRQPAGGPGWRDHHLYDGSIGAGLFFTALAAVSGRPHWARAAHEAMAPIRAHAERHPLSTVPRNESIGGGNGLGSVVYGLVVVAGIDGNRSWLDLARGLAAAIPERVTRFSPVDVVNGSAGAVLSLLALHEVTGDQAVLEAANVCGRHLLDGERLGTPGAGGWSSDQGTRLVGFAHGAAGIACALARLFASTNDDAYRRAARRTYGWVRRCYLPGPANWPVAVTRDGSAAQGLMNGWCHGAPGVALSAIVAAGARRSPAIVRGIESALQGVAEWRPAQADHLCCGALGRAEVLLAAGERLGRADAIDQARALAARVVDRAGRRGHFRLSGAGTDYRVFDPGFFQGLSGIGYQLLRLARPSGLPSVASFDAPRPSLRYCSPVAARPGGFPTTSSSPADAAGTELT
jgi:type 2 lantibiotic biosynthesis protein LanM